MPAFLAALTAGYNINVATTTLDSANARIFSSFTRGGGMGLDEMTGSPNLTIVPDPATFRVLPWAPGVGWVLCDEYFNSGVPFHFSTRQLLRKHLERLADMGLGCVVGLEIEWYLLRVAQDHLDDENTGIPGMRGRPVKTAPVEPGFSYHSESNMDLMQPVLSALAEAYEQIGLPLRSIENEWGPGQLECTFAARPALEAADHALLVPHRHAPDLPPDGLLRHLHVPPGAQGLLFQRLAPASVAGRRQERAQRVHAGARARMPVAARPRLSRRPAETCRSLRPRSRRRPSTAIDDISRTRSRPTAPPGATTTAA